MARTFRDHFTKNLTKPVKASAFLDLANDVQFAYDKIRQSRTVAIFGPLTVFFAVRLVADFVENLILEPDSWVCLGCALMANSWYCPLLASRCLMKKYERVGFVLVCLLPLIFVQLTLGEVILHEVSASGRKLLQDSESILILVCSMVVRGKFAFVAASLTTIFLANRACQLLI